MPLLISLLDIYSWVIVARAVVSWVSPLADHPAVRLLAQATEPVLSPLRKLVPPRALGGIDVSPILAMVALQGIRYLLMSVA